MKFRIRLTAALAALALVLSTGMAQAAEAVPQPGQADNPCCRLG